ncbi:MAG: P-loop NTPase [Actinomycetes bacterium]
MDILDYLKALRRRWRVIALVTVIAAGAAFWTTPAAEERSAVPVGTVYQATTTLLRAPDALQVDLSLIRLYVQTGEIPKRAAEKLGHEGAPAGLAAQVTVGGDNEVGTVTIGTTGPDAERAERVANTFAEETIAYLAESAETNQQRAITVTNKAVNKVNTQIFELDGKIAEQPEGSSRRAILEAQRSALLNQLQGLFGRLGELTTSAASPAPLNVLEPADAYPQLSGAPSIQAPQTRSPRVIVGLLVGLLVGGAAALLIERLDTRVQGRGMAEAAFGLPVVAEIPHLSRRLRRAGRVISVAAPESAAAEAYRGLRAALLLMPSRALLGEDPRTERVESGSVVLVTAPTPRSGKSTTAVNLAACLAESGRRVLVVDADFRNPAISELLGVGGKVGLTDLALMGDAGQLDKVVQTSTVAPVRVLTAGRRVSTGGVMEGNVQGILAQARTLADVVIVDAAPLLSGSDALDVMPHVDSVVVVGRVRRTTRDQAVRARELLARIGVPVLGVALVGSRTPTVGPSGGSGLRERLTSMRPTTDRRRAERPRHSAHSGRG